MATLEAGGRVGCAVRLAVAALMLTGSFPDSPLFLEFL